MKLLVVDDHPIFRDGLAALLRQSVDQATVLQAPGCASALDIAHEEWITLTDASAPETGRAVWGSMM